jgi:hypothetical protein
MNPEIGVIQRQEIAARSAPGTVVATEAFAVAIAERYAPRAVTVSCADMALAWEPPAEINYFNSSPRIEISPTINIEDRYLFGAASAVSRDLPGAPAAPAGSSEAAAGALFERIFSRHIRVTAFEPPPRTDPSGERGRRAIDMPRQTDAVERIVHRAMVGEKAAASPSPAEPAAALPVAARESAWGMPAPAFSPSARETGWGSPFAFPEAPKALTLPAPEIKRVAEQVMREIDRRVIARRERTGKR